jgi:hypothetical protein
MSLKSNAPNDSPGRGLAFVGQPYAAAFAFIALFQMGDELVAREARVILGGVRVPLIRFGILDQFVLFAGRRRVIEGFPCRASRY